MTTSNLYEAGITLSPEDEAFRDEWRAWLDENLPKDLAGKGVQLRVDHEERTKTLRQWHDKLYEGRWAGISWPAAYGGRDATPLQQLIFREELNTRHVPRQMMLGGLGDMVARNIMDWGTAQQQEYFLPRLLRREINFCQGFSEPDAGSDLAGLQTRAVLDGDEFIVNGSKIWTSNAQVADWCFLLVRTNPDVPKHRGISVLLVDMKTPGIEIQPIRQISGESHFNQVFFTDVRVPRENLLGEIDGGWPLTRSALQEERSGLAATQLVENTLASLVRLAQRTTMEDGETAWEDDGYRRSLARAFVTIESLRQLGWTMLMKQVKNEDLGAYPAVGKLAQSEIRHTMTELSLEMLGPAGVLMGESPLAVNRGMAAYAYLVERGATIGGGTSEMQRNVIGEKGLGLPKG